MTAIWLSGNIAAMRIGWGDATFFFAPDRLALIFFLCVGGFLTAFLTRGATCAGDADEPSEGLRRRFKIACFGIFWALFLVYLPACDHAGVWVFPEGRWMMPLRYAGLTMLVLGGLLRLMAVMAREAAGAAKLVHTGVYQSIRHPEYLGILLVLLGFALAFRSLWGLCVWALWVGVVVARIHREEARLLHAMQGAWRRYRTHTWRLVPGLY